MSQTSPEGIISATRLHRYIVCRRRPFMDLYGPPEKRLESESLRNLFDRGLAHEAQVTMRPGLLTTTPSEASRRPLALAPRVPTAHTPRARARETEDYLREGAARIFQGVLITGEWWGSPDYLIKTRGASRFGRWHHYPADAKLVAKVPQRAHIIPVVFYALQLERIQGRLPSKVVIVGTSGPHVVRTSDHVADTIDRINGLESVVRDRIDPGPQLGAHCQRCPWRRVCERDARRTQDLSLVPALRPEARATLRSRGIGDLRALAAADPRRLSDVPTLARGAALAVHQAAAFIERKASLISSENVPPESPVELFLDFETVSSGTGGQVVVVYSLLAQTGDVREHHFVVARSQARTELRRAWHDFVAIMSRYPEGAPIFHYSAHEKTLLRSVPSPSAVAFCQRLVDVLPIVKRDVALPTRSRALKDVALSLGLRRSSRVADGLAAMDLWWRWVRGRRRSPVCPAPTLLPRRRRAARRSPAAAA